MGTFQLTSFIIYNGHLQCYKKVISINSMPSGSLKELIKKGKIEKSLLLIIIQTVVFKHNVLY